MTGYGVKLRFVLLLVVLQGCGDGGPLLENDDALQLAENVAPEVRAALEEERSDDVIYERVQAALGDPQSWPAGVADVSPEHGSSSTRLAEDADPGEAPDGAWSYSAALEIFPEEGDSYCASFYWTEAGHVEAAVTRRNQVESCGSRGTLHPRNQLGW